LTVEGRSEQDTAQQVVDSLAPMVAALKLPPGYRIELGAEIEEAAEANTALGQYLPHAAVAMLILFVWQFGSFRKLALILAIIPFALIGVAPALKIAGEPLGFMANFGLLSLAGIIVNNAGLLLERIEAELRAGRGTREAVVSSAVQRMRPIVMTKLTCVAGLVPLLLFGGPLWSGMAVTIIGGLGTRHPGHAGPGAGPVRTCCPTVTFARWSAAEPASNRSLPRMSGSALAPFFRPVCPGFRISCGCPAASLQRPCAPLAAPLAAPAPGARRPPWPETSAWAPPAPRRRSAASVRRPRRCLT
jgi:hypothetical protein